MLGKITRVIGGGQRERGVGMTGLRRAPEGKLS